MLLNFLKTQKLLAGLIAASVFWLWFNILLLLNKISPLIDMDLPRSVKLRNNNGAMVRYDEMMILEETTSQKKKRGKKVVPPTSEYPVFDQDGYNPHKLDLEYFPELVVAGLGDLGEPASRPDFVKQSLNESLNEHSFDSGLSDHMSLNRRLPDARGERCAVKDAFYSKDLPSTSVIICFHNEAESVLLRTVHSIVNRTPRKVLVDIILVNDASKKGHNPTNLAKHLSRLNSSLPDIRIVYKKNKHREGIVRSRLKGAQIAKGRVLIFLDSHCEVTKGWVQPLLRRIKQNRKNVVCPVIEVIDPVNFSYKGAELDDIKQVGSFNWDLFFTWKDLPEEHLKKDRTQPLKSPTMAGGLFAIDKSYFYEVGSYDNKMEIWGGENLELSFRVWMCGGNLEIIPCSRVGHVFRKSTSPYSFPNGVGKTLAKNFKRVAEVWMDDYKHIYYRRNTEVLQDVDIGPISNRKLLRHALKCKSFKWYVDNVLFDVIGVEPYPTAFGEIRLNGTKDCLDSLGSKEKHSRLQLYPCHGLGGNQFFTLGKKFQIIHNEEVCLDSLLRVDSTKRRSYQVVTTQCQKKPLHTQEWKHIRANGRILHRSSKKCLASDKSGYLTLDKCNTKKNNQRWTFGTYNETSSRQT